MTRAKLELVDKGQEFEVFKGKIRSGFKLHLIQTKFGRSSEQVELLTNSLTSTILECSKLLGLDPNSIELEAVFDDITNYSNLHGKRKKPIGEATSKGVALPFKALLECSTGDFLANLELTSTLAHELHHVSRIRKFPNYFEKLIAKNRSLTASIRNNPLPKELKTLQGEYWATNTSSLAEISAQLFAKEYIRDYYLKRPNMAKDRKLSALLSMVDFSLDLFNKRMLRTYRSLIDKPLTL